MIEQLEGSTYLGDGLYAKYDNRAQQVGLFTSNGIDITNSVYLDGPVLSAFLRFLKGIGVALS